MRKVHKNLRFSDGTPMSQKRQPNFRYLKWCFGGLLMSCGVMAGLVALWAANPSSSYYRQIAAEIEHENDDWVARVTRELPRGDFTGTWEVQVWVRRGEASFVCQSPPSRTVEYESNRGPTISYVLPYSVARCLNEAPPISLVWTRQVLLWGWLPLRPTEDRITVNPTAEEVPDT